MSSSAKSFLIALLLLIISLVFELLQTSEYPFQMTFLDVGQGDATYILFPDGTDMLVDCGRNRSVLHELGSVMGLLDRQIDVLVITHPDSDHYAGCIDVLERFDVRTVVLPDFEKDTMLDGEVHKAIKKEVFAGALEVIPTAGTSWQFGSSTVHVLAARSQSDGVTSNNASLVLQLRYASTSILLTGDAEAELEQELVDMYDLKSDVLKIGHHGSKTSSILPFIQEVDPDYGVISAGYKNSYGHPHKEVVDRVSSNGITLYRTDIHGRIYLFANEEGYIIDGEFANE